MSYDVISLSPAEPLEGDLGWLCEQQEVDAWKLTVPDER